MAINIKQLGNIHSLDPVMLLEISVKQIIKDVSKLFILAKKLEMTYCLTVKNLSSKFTEWNFLQPLTPTAVVLGYIFNSYVNK